jgi:predicted PurR-regulated permease PerM
MHHFSLSKSIKVLLFLFLLIAGLVYAKPFLVPLTIAALFSMLLLPFCAWLQQKGSAKWLATLASVLLFVIVVGSIIWLIVWQVSDLSKDASGIEQNLNKKIEEFRQYIKSTFGLSVQKQNELVKAQSNSSSGSGFASKILAGLGGFLTNTILVLVYMFLFLYFRTHIKKFILLITPKENASKTQKIIENCRKVAQKYLTGLAMMIGCLWVMYGIGFSIVGVKGALFFAILCGLLEIVPFVGNLTGNAITVLMVIAQGGSLNMILGVIVTYAIVQFLQTYLLEPLVVGSEVNINPLFTIIGLVIGEQVWGIPGMILAIPLLGITKIICDNVDDLKPYGFLLGTNKSKSKK